MPRKALWVAARVGFAVVTTVVALTITSASNAWAASQEKVLHSFTAGASDGAQPEAGLVLDRANNLYGTTAFGGYGNCSGGCGVVFEISPVPGGWSESVIYIFHGGEDGFRPFTTLTLDKQGNLYGTTIEGGIYSGGVVFKLTRPSSGGVWTQSTLHSFGSGADGNEPYGTLAFDDAGNLYGTTYAAGDHNAGMVFELSPATGGDWTESVLYNFTNSADGGFPSAGVVLDAAGNLYGTTTVGGSDQSGVAFEMTQMAGGNWQETVLHSFNVSGDGYTASSGLVFDAAGNLYGTTTAGVGKDCGTVYELSPTELSPIELSPAPGAWTETVLFSFDCGSGGRGPIGGVVLDQAGNLYGNTQAGGQYVSGVVFELTPVTGGAWTETVLHTLGKGLDGATPEAGLVMDKAGHLFGATLTGGADEAGTVFAVGP